MNPHLLPKVRSAALLDACRSMDCTLRIASFIPGHSCAPQATVVPCHVGRLGRGTATKVSDLSVAAGCRACHDLIDGRDKRLWEIMDRYPAAFVERVMLGVFETQAQWVGLGLLSAPGMEIV